MEVTAQLRQLRIAPRKVRLAVNLVRGLSVVQAEQQLQFMNKISALPLLKLLRSAVANAENNHKLSRESLRVVEAATQTAPTLKRTGSRARGSSTLIRKRASHIKIVLSDE